MLNASSQNNGESALPAGQGRRPEEGMQVDVLIIGGGIVGAGAARDAAMRGLSTLVIDQHDFAFGTSSRSSRLLHGGLRYLAQGRIGLVREANREKQIVGRIAPHLVQPLPFIFPFRGQKHWPGWKLRLGVKLYDWLGGGNFERCASLNREQTLGVLPGLRDDPLQGSVRYYDALTNDARLVIDTLLSAAHAGAVASNYCRLIDAERQRDRWECMLEDRLHQRIVNVCARTVVNASGPWSMRTPNSGVRLRLTKGVHLVVERRRLPIVEAAVLTEEKRILFAIPWGERVILGTTDSEYHDAIDTPRCDVDDATYVLGVMNDAFPDANLRLSDVRSTWAGLRPLIADNRGGPSDISRQHQIAEGEPGWLDVSGGKLTTYRLIAEQVVDRLLRHLGKPRKASATATTPLIASRPKDETVGAVPPPISEAIVRRCVEQEWAIHLDDVMIRRTSWRHYELNHRAAAERVSQWMASLLNWTEPQRQAECARYMGMCDELDRAEPRNSPPTEAAGHAAHQS